MLMSSEESLLSSGPEDEYRVHGSNSEEMPASESHVVCGDGAASMAAAAVCGNNGASSTAPHGTININATRKGKYSRSNTRKKRNHPEQAGDHYSLIKNSSLGAPCGLKCVNSGRCGDTITKNELYACHEISYGVTVRDPKTGTWVTSHNCSKAHDIWRELLSSFVSYNEQNKASFVYKTASRVTCADFARAAYGIPKVTWDSYISLLRKQPHALEAQAEVRRWDKAAKAALAQERSSTYSEAVGWWMQILPLWDAIPNESIIKHPRLVWDRLYELYCAEIALGSGSPPLKSVKDNQGVYTGRAPGSWFNARKEALRRYSIKHFGLKPVDPRDASTSLSPEPKCLFRLKARADHSNYPECSICRASRMEVERLISESAPRARINEERGVLMTHVHEMMAERDVCAELAGDAGRSNKIVFCLDDKLGSHWQFLPIPPGGRDGKQTAGRWRYRQCLQGNSFPGVGNFLSVVPPMLHTGSNFGCSAFVYSLYRLIETGKLDARASRIVRQTDGGPDNVAWVTHAVHFMLVREGVFDQIDWIRLLPGHSHNPQDQTFSTAKTIFIPTPGAGIGCASPWEMESRLVNGLRKMNGGLEMLWQLASFDFTGWLDGCVSAKFAHYGNERYWRYLFDATLVEHGFVHVSYKTALTDRATDSAAEFKPLLPPVERGCQQQTDPSGIQFMLKYPSLADNPGVEPWEGTNEDTNSADAGWNREKVKTDVLKIAELEKFSEPQVAEWRALFDFHEKYQTADDLPHMPIALSAEDGRSLLMTGMPIAWDALWSKLSGRFARPHHQNTGNAASTAQSDSGADAVRRNTGSAAASMLQPPPLSNSVTGLNYLPAARQREVSANTMRTRVAAMPAFLPAEEIVSGQLYFVDIPEFEGELRVGLGRAEKELSEDGSKMRVGWLQRRVWSNNPDVEGFRWQSTPTFDAARQENSRRVLQSFEPLEAFLPVHPELTSTWGHHDPELSLAHKKQRFKLTKRCITQLLELIRSKRPELRRTAEDAAAALALQLSAAPSVAVEAASASTIAASASSTAREQRPCQQKPHPHRRFADSSDESCSSAPESYSDVGGSHGQDAQPLEAEVAKADSGRSIISSVSGRGAGASHSSKRPRRMRNTVDRFS